MLCQPRQDVLMQRVSAGVLAGGEQCGRLPQDAAAAPGARAAEAARGARRQQRPGCAGSANLQVGRSGVPHTTLYPLWPAMLMHGGCTTSASLCVRQQRDAVALAAHSSGGEISLQSRVLFG